MFTEEMKTRYRDKRWERLEDIEDPERSFEIWINRILDPHLTTTEEAVGLIHSAFQGSRGNNPQTARAIMWLACEKVRETDTDEQKNSVISIRNKARHVFFLDLLRRRDSYHALRWIRLAKMLPQIVGDIAGCLHEMMDGYDHTKHEREAASEFVRLSLEYAPFNNGLIGGRFDENVYASVTVAVPQLIELVNLLEITPRLWWREPSPDQFPQCAKLAEERDHALVHALENVVIHHHNQTMQQAIALPGNMSYLTGELLRYYTVHRSELNLQIKEVSKALSWFNRLLSEDKDSSDDRAYRKERMKKKAELAIRVSELETELMEIPEL